MLCLQADIPIHANPPLSLSYLWITIKLPAIHFQTRPDHGVINLHVIALCRKIATLSEVSRSTRRLRGETPAMPLLRCVHGDVTQNPATFAFNKWRMQVWKWSKDCCASLSTVVCLQNESRVRVLQADTLQNSRRRTAKCGKIFDLSIIIGTSLQCITYHK